MNILNPNSDADKILKVLVNAGVQKKRNSLAKSFKSDLVINALMQKDYLPIQMLLVHYLGIMESVVMPNTRKNILLSILFKTEGAENIRKNLSNLNPLKTENNLQVIAGIFKELQLEKELVLVTNDLNKILKK